MGDSSCVDTKKDTVSNRKLLKFFIPLGLSASLVTISHIIINSTLTRADNPELIIASYVIAMSLFSITERLGVLLRHTCSALVRDRKSFQLMAHVAFYVITTLMLISVTIAFTPLGSWIFSKLFGVETNMVGQIVEVYQILVIVILFSAIRCLFQGVIILNKQTKWLTFGMVIRLIGMYLLSLYFIHTGNINAKTGAYIFLLGMMIESIVSYIEGRFLVKKMVNEDPSHKITTKSQIFRFYKPLILSSLIIVLVAPLINVFLGKTNDIELAIAAYAIAFSITQLMLSFFTYIHQIVLTFYNENSEKVKKFTFTIGVVPVIVLALFNFTPLGHLFIENIIGANDRLLEASLQALRFFLIMAVVFPILDYCNGLLLLRSQTSVMVYSQTTHVLVLLAVLVTASSIVPQWNGMIGSLAHSMGMAAELGVVSLFILKKNRGLKKNQANINKMQNKLAN
ncbi:multi antimicrobial extrusion protein MatE [Anaerobacillus alkaliphilus]|uniref:multi antimicrobial extrusion protein MatE n=1 Tax=Anaerobacillus alkaliphilus TaxID=1548597 RepID=UPI0018A92E68|nr:multi antimicrobial extrusion protein MatE [Anaerobacillus alkaliphilus]